MINNSTPKKMVTRAGLLLAVSMFFLLAGMAVIGVGALHHSNVKPDLLALLEQPLSLLQVAVALFI